MGNPSPPEVWDLPYETDPAAGDVVSQGDDWIRQVKLDVRKRGEVERHFGSINSDDNGLLRLGSGRVFVQSAAPTDLAFGAYNSSSGATTSTLLGTAAPNSVAPPPANQIGHGRTWFDPDDSLLHVYNGGWVPVAGGVPNKVDSKTSFENAVMATVATDTITTAIAVPSSPGSATYRMSILATLHGIVFSANGVGASNVTCFIAQSIGAGAFVDVKSGILEIADAAPGSHTHSSAGVITVQHTFTPALGSSYRFQIRPTVSASGTFPGGALNANNTVGVERFHEIRVELTRVT